MPNDRAKRILDLTLGAALLLASLPLQTVLALTIRLESPGPILHRALRVGREGEPFTLYKFRSMVQNAASVGPRITGRADPRVTRVGKLLRRTKLDELPQLWNVVRGDMSLVGPRPEDARFVALYSPEQRLALSVRPGITGPSQLVFRHEEEMLAGDDPEAIYVRDVLPRKLEIDVQYARTHNTLSDLRILAQTALTLSREVGRHRAPRRPIS